MDETQLIIGAHRVLAFRNTNPGPPWTAVCSGKTIESFRVDGRTLRSVVRQIQRKLYKDGAIDRKLHAINI